MSIGRFVDVSHFDINGYERRQICAASIQNHTMYCSSFHPRIPQLEAATDALSVEVKTADRR